MVKEEFFTVHWSLFAQQNLKDIYDFIRSDSQRKAVKITSGIVY